MTDILEDEELRDPRALAYYSPIEATPELVSKWDAWKNDYVVGCMNTWLTQGASRDEVLECGAMVLAELNSIDDLPWTPMGAALTIKIEAVLSPGDQPWTGQRRIDFMSACRTLDVGDQGQQELASAYQMGISLEQLQATARKAGKPRPTAQRSALYRHFDKKGVLLYVGISDNPVARSAQHQANSPWHKFSEETTVEWFDTRTEADAAERAAIRDERPAFNTTHNARNRKAAIDYLFAALESGPVT